MENKTKLETLRVAHNLRKEISYTEGMMATIDHSTRGAIDELLTEAVKIVNAESSEEMEEHWKNVRDIAKLFISEEKSEPEEF